MSVPHFFARVIVLSVLSSSVMLGQKPPSAGALPDLGSVKAIHVTGFGEMTGPDRQIAACLMEKLAAKGPFTFPDAPDAADAVLTWTSKHPSGLSRVTWGVAPRIAATLAAPNGRVLWTDKYSYRRPVWKIADIPCGLANGLVNKLARDISQRQKASKQP